MPQNNGGGLYTNSTVYDGSQLSQEAGEREIRVQNIVIGPKAKRLPVLNKLVEETPSIF